MSDQLSSPSVSPVPPAPVQPVPPTGLAQDLSSVSQGMLAAQPPAQPVGGPRRRELGSAPLPETGNPAVEAAPAPEVAPVPETEKSVEMGPELEKFVEQTERQKKIAAETVVAAQTMPTQTPKTVSKPVVVLPLTEKIMQSGQRKSTKFSVRWLSEWCVRQIKKFHSMLVVYRENE